MAREAVRVLVLDDPAAAGWARRVREEVVRRIGREADVTVDVHPGPPAAELAEALASRAFDDVDVVVLSVRSGLRGDGDIAASRAAFRAGAAEAIALLKAAGVTTFVLNASTVLADHDAYRGSREVAALNLVCLQLSMETGVSIVDIDRTIAELGGTDHVVGQLRYSETADGAIANVVAGVLEDYGFFDDRPLLAQVGQAARG
jgi:hypothetical protein